MQKRKMPAIEPGFIAMATNFDTHSGNGTSSAWALVSVAEHGVIPKGAVERGSKMVWPDFDWAKAHEQRLLPLRELRPKLNGSYSHEKINGDFTGKTYLKHIVKIDMSDFRWAHTTDREPYVPSGGGKSSKKYRYNGYRDGWSGSWITDKRATIDAHKKLGRKLGVNIESTGFDRRDLYDAVKDQIYKDRPVYIGINTRVSRKSFQSYKVLGNGDLLPRGRAKYGSHAVVAIAHCDDWQTKDSLCKQFAPAMEKRNIKECIVIENSWGSDAHQRGLVCVSRLASRRVLRKAALLKEVFDR